MRVLCVCDEGNNRSVTVAHQLKYLGHDVLTAGLKRNDPDTLWMLCDWADRVIFTEKGQRERVDHPLPSKALLWDLGPDTYKRPFNPDLLYKVRKLVASRAAADLAPRHVFRDIRVVDNPAAGISLR